MTTMCIISSLRRTDTPDDWARKMQGLLRRACHATNLARERGGMLKPGLIALIGCRRS
jgi:hypothetical protein